jgi:hypothetical protein
VETPTKPSQRPITSQRPVSRGKTIQLSYDPVYEIVDVAFPPQAHLHTREEIDIHFDFMFSWWRRTCGKKVYFLVDYDNFFVDLKQNEHYGTRMRQVMREAALGVVRYGGEPLQRTGVRLFSMRNHSPSNLYADRAAALEVIQHLRSGTLTTTTVTDAAS